MELAHLERVAQQYRDEGYEVILEPRGEAVPRFLNGFQPDLIARRGDENIVAEVALKRGDLADDAQLLATADRINRQPGWRLDLIVLERETMADKALRVGVEPDAGAIGAMIEAAEEMAASGFLPYAYVAALGGLEAATRHRCRGIKGHPGGAAIDHLNKAYSADLLTREHYIALRDAFKVRSQIVHGLVPPPLEPESIHFVTGIARTMLSGVEATGPARNFAEAVDHEGA